MGMFDEVLLVCPDCGETLLQQSKAGEGYLGTYTQYTGVPTKIANDIVGNFVYCTKTGKRFKIKMEVPDRVKLTLEEHW